MLTKQNVHTLCTGRLACTVSAFALFVCSVTSGSGADDRSFATYLKTRPSLKVTDTFTQCEGNPYVGRFGETPLGEEFHLSKAVTPVEVDVHNQIVPGSKIVDVVTFGVRFSLMRDQLFEEGGVTYPRFTYEVLYGDGNVDLTTDGNRLSVMTKDKVYWIVFLLESRGESVGLMSSCYLDILEHGTSRGS